MAAPILILDDMTLDFGGSPLFEGVSLQIEAGDRICLVGRNGSGKSTLLKVAAGEVEADSGTRFLHPGATLRLLPQEPDLRGFPTVLAYVEAGLGPGDDRHRARHILEELGLTGLELPVDLSGGETRRAALARVLAPEPDILLLDEPTNHLDLPAIEWLEGTLAGLRSALVIISHDRRFLEKLTRKTVWLDRGQSRFLNKGFAAFEAWRDKAMEGEETERHRLNRKIVREEHWITFGVTGRRRRNMRRLRELADLKRNRIEARRATGTVAIAAGDQEISGRLAAKLVNVTKRFGDRAIVSNLSLIVNRGDRLGLVGPNGAGKTTLVNLITGKLKPDSGEVKLGAGLDMLVIEQKRDALNPERSLKDTLTDGAGDTLMIGGQPRHVMSYMQDFLFGREQAGTPVRVLSGGERARLLLARGLKNPSNLLVLDEPTNDLDLETLDILQEFLSDYAGTVLLVSHDRDFLDRICTSVVASNGDGVWREYAGGYSDMVAQKGSGVGAITPRRPEQRASAAGMPPANPAKTQGRSAKLSFKQKFALENLPGEIEKLQAQAAHLKNELADPKLYSNDPAKFDAVAKKLADSELALAAKETEWLELEMLRERIGG